MTNNVMTVSGRQQSDFVIHTSIHSTQTPLPWLWAQSSVQHSRSLLVIHFKYNSVYTRLNCFLFQRERYIADEYNAW